MKEMTDITMLIEFVFGVIGLATTYFVLPWVRANKHNKNVQTTLAIANTVVRSARELDITNELAALGKTKAEYALEELKKSLAAKNIKFDDAELEAYIKDAVTQLRIELNKTEKSLSVEEKATKTSTKQK